MRDYSPEPQAFMEVNAKTYEALKRAHAKATRAGAEEFRFKGQPLQTRWALCLLQYMAMRLN
jgi:hypothetical protein